MSITYRTRLLSGFLGLAIIASGLVFFLSTRQAKRSVFKQIQSTVLSVALDAASRVDAAEHERIRSEDDVAGDAYQGIRRALREVRDRNRRDDIHITYIYTFRKVGSDPDRWAYVVDSEEPGANRSPVGQLIVWDEQGTPRDEPLRLGPAYVDQGFINDVYGTWLSAQAPIRDSSGTIVAMVGVDIAADEVIAEQAQVTRWSLVALGLAVSLAAVLSVVLARVASRPLGEIAAAVKKVGAGRLETRLSEHRGDEFGELARAVNEMAQSLQERDALKGALSRYVSQDAASRLIEEQMLPQLRGECRDVTVLIGDIANLSRVAEVLPPEQLVELLNEYFEKMVGIIFRHHGTIDRLLGNRLIAVFGAPIADEKKERNAIRAAIAMRRAQSELDEKWRLTGDQKFRLGVGIHTGKALLGNIGTQGNVEFTVVGSSVEIASLIGGKNVKYQTDALVSESTVAAVRDEFGFTEVGDIHPSGITDFIRLYSVREIMVSAAG